MKPLPVLPWSLGVFVLVGHGLAQTSTPASPPDRPVDRVFKQGQQAERSGDFRGAIEKYEDAKRLAIQTNDKKVGASAAIQQARVIQTAIAADHSGPARVEQVVTNYHFVIENGSPQERVLAQNNLGALLVQQNQPGAALRVLEAMDLSLVDPANRFLAHYNLGRARELSRDANGAWTNYVEAVRRQPGYTPAVEGAFRVAGTIRPRQVRAMADLATNLIAQGELRAVEKELRQALRLCAREPDAADLLAARVRYYIGAGLTPPEFERSEQALLGQLGERSPALQGYIRELTNVYRAGFKPVFDPGQARALFPFWTGQPRQTRALSDLLSKTGDYYSRRDAEWSAERAEKALASYLASWLVEPRNTGPAVAVAAILRENLDWKPSRQALVDRFIEVVFDVKGGLYRFGPLAQPEDLVNLLRLHLILASIFEEKKQWRSPEPFRSVIFQLTQAVELENQIQRTKADYIPSPGLHDRLGNAYQQTGSPLLAWEQYVRAGESFVRLANVERARASLGKARSTAAPLQEGQRQRLAALEAQINRLGKL